MSGTVDKFAIFSLALTGLSISISPYPFVLILAYVIHELGHVIFAKICGAKMKRFKIGGFHLSLSYDCSKISYKKEFLVCVGGIIFNITSATIALLIPLFKGEGKEFFIICSFSLAFMNLYPAEILDGGGMLKAILNSIFPPAKSEKILAGVSIFAIILLWMISVYFQLVFSSNMSLFLISILLLMEFCFVFIK